MLFAKPVIIIYGIYYLRIFTSYQIIIFTYYIIKLKKKTLEWAHFSIKIKSKFNFGMHLLTLKKYFKRFSSCFC